MVVALEDPMKTDDVVSLVELCKLISGGLVSVLEFIRDARLRDATVKERMMLALVLRRGQWATPCTANERGQRDRVKQVLV